MFHVPVDARSIPEAIDVQKRPIQAFRGLLGSGCIGFAAELIGTDPIGATSDEPCELNDNINFTPSLTINLSVSLLADFINALVPCTIAIHILSALDKYEQAFLTDHVIATDSSIAFSIYVQAIRSAVRAFMHEGSTL